MPTLLRWKGYRFCTPLWWYPRLLSASPAQRDTIRLMPLGMHWPDIDEDISVASMLRGQKAPGAKPPEAGRLRQMI